MTICVIPARGGSKRIPKKNIKLFLGKPMIAYSIEAALASNIFSKVIVSTDDMEIISVAKEHGAEVPFKRPSSISTDRAGTLPVIQHAIQFLSDKGTPPDKVCCLYPTAPLIRSEDLVSGFEILNKSEYKFVFSVGRFKYPIQRALKIKDQNGGVEMFFPENKLARSQDLEVAYHDAGAFYFGEAAAFMSGVDIFSNNSMPYILPDERVCDIDDMADWLFAEKLKRLAELEIQDRS